MEVEATAAMTVTPREVSKSIIEEVAKEVKLPAMFGIGACGFVALIAKKTAQTHTLIYMKREKVLGLVHALKTSRWHICLRHVHCSSDRFFFRWEQNFFHHFPFIPFFPFCECGVLHFQSKVYLYA